MIYKLYTIQEIGNVFLAVYRYIKNGLLRNTQFPSQNEDFVSIFTFFLKPLFRWEKKKKEKRKGVTLLAGKCRI